MPNHTAHPLSIHIIGGGLAGTVAALALAQQGHRIIIDGLATNATGASKAPEGLTESIDNYERPLALSASSLRILAHIAQQPLADFCQQISATDIASIHVSEQGHVNRLQLRAPEFSVDRFGAVVSANKLLANIYHLAQEHSNITLDNSDFATSGRAKVDLTILANGATSPERDALGFETITQPYRESALTGIITVNAEQPNTAFERFTADGPLALLPFGDQRYAYVITVDNKTPAKANSPANIQQIIEQRFGYRLGNITAIQPHACFSLTLRYAKTLVSHDTVLLGNTALSIHPIAGQGYNLVVRDIAWLVEALASHASLENRLAAYAKMRQRDHQITRHFTHSLVTLFDQPWLWAPRGIGLGLANWSKGVQKLFTSIGSGQLTRQPKLSFGIHPSAAASVSGAESLSGNQSRSL